MIKNGQNPYLTSAAQPPESRSLGALVHDLSFRAERAESDWSYLKRLLKAGADLTQPQHSNALKPVQENIKALVAICTQLEKDGNITPSLAVEIAYALKGIAKMPNALSNGKGPSVQLAPPRDQPFFRKFVDSIIQEAAEAIDEMLAHPEGREHEIHDHIEDLLRVVKDTGTKGYLELLGRQAKENVRAIASSEDSWIAAANTSTRSAPLAPDQALRPQRPASPQRGRALSRPPALPSIGGIAGVSIHLPHDPLPEELRSIKVKWPKVLYRNESFGKEQHSKLYDAHSAYIVLTQKMGGGSFGKIRWGFVPGHPVALAVKEIRHIPSRQRRVKAEHGKNVTPPEDALNEITMTKHLRGIIERQMQSLDALSIHEEGSLKRVRDKADPFVLHTIIKNDAKTYVVMSKDGGDLYRLGKNLPPYLCPVAAMSLAAQGFSELAALHDHADMAHLDLSMGNIFFSASGQMKLMDFGLCLPVTDGITEFQGYRGTIVTPESVGFVAGDRSDPRSTHLSVATDVFVLAILVARLAAVSDREIVNPFSHTFRLTGLENTPRREAARAMFKEFSAWRSRLADPATGRISAQAVIDSKPNHFTSFFTPLALVDERLFDLVMNDGLQLEARKRANAKDLAGPARNLVPVNSPNMTSLRRAMQALGAEEQMQGYYHNALLYDAWDKKQTLEYQRAIEQSRGKPRNLPG